jgi:ornithine cyclodeaminase/alanine dehydrogenase-like protein (mu-crystallin family)
MKLRLLNQQEVERLLDMASCIDLMDAALRALSRGDAVVPLRNKVMLPDRSGLLGMMPGYLGDPKSLGLKVVTVFHGNHDAGLPSHQGVVMLFDVATGAPLGLFDAGAITAIRTAAASGAATRLLARGDAGDLALLGSGVQARTHLDAMRAVRPLRRVRVWSRTEARARAFAERESRRLAIPIESMPSAEAAVRGADLVCTTTAAKEPILQGEWLSPGAHVNAVGSSFASNRELDAAAVKRSRLFTDCRESALNEAGDFLIAKREGAIGDDHLLGELGEVLLGKIPGRRTPGEITLYKSLGIAVEDLAAAHFLLNRANETNAGVQIEWSAG